MQKSNSPKQIVLLMLAFLCVVSLIAGVSALSDGSPGGAVSLKQDVSAPEGPAPLNAQNQNITTQTIPVNEMPGEVLSDPPSLSEIQPFFTTLNQYTTEGIDYYGSIYVTTNPAGASVYVFDLYYGWIYQGTTPLTISYVTPGQYYMAISKDGFDDVFGWVTVNAGYTTTVDIQLTSSSLPVAAFTGTPTSGTAPLTVQFTDSSTNTPTSWSWSFGDGSTSTLQNPSHIYTNAGTYTVLLTATNAAGSNTKTAANYITVSSGGGVPVANFVGTPTSGTAPLTVTFTDSSTGSPTSWSWNFGDGSTSTLQNPCHTYTSSGTYTVALTATNTAGSNTKTAASYITVSSGGGEPVANFVGTPTSGTAPLTVTFTDRSTGSPTSWSWNFGDGNSSTLQNPCHTYTSPGTYTVALTATNAAGSNTKTAANYITVSSGGGGPVANFVGTPTSGTAPLTVQFTDSSTNMLMDVSTRNQQDSGSGFIIKTIPVQGTTGAQNPVPEKFVPIVGVTSDEFHAAPTNPEFIKYMQEKPYDSKVQDGTHGLGLIPSPISRPEVRDIQMFAPNAGDRVTSYPSTFDLRTTGKVSPIKNQDPWGTCWAFATFASLESTLMPTTPTPDFSEKNLVNLAGFVGSSDPETGGDQWKSTAYLTRWNGPVNEATDPYPTSTWTTSSTYPPVKHVQNVVFFPARTSRTDTDNIKGALTQWGAVYSGFYWSPSFYNTAQSSYYQPPTSADTGGGGHAVTIIGWDDAYAATNFNTAPAGPGAWIVKNSWGTTWGNNGYFYMSYYDKKFGSVLQSSTSGDTGGPFAVNAYDTAVFFGESTSNYDTVYSYDKLGEVNDYVYPTTSKKTGSFANVFTATSSGTIKAVGFYTTDLNVPCTISIYKNLTSGPVGGTPAAQFSETLPYMGYNTVVIPSSQQVSVTTGDKFSVVVQVTNPTNDYYIPIEENVNGYTSGITSQSGQGYLLGSSGWTDLKTLLDNSHVCVKAYTGSGTPSPMSWSWNFGDGSTSTLQNPSHTYTSTGTYTVALTATNAAGSNTKTAANYITVSSGGGGPVANFVGTPTSGTAPLTVQFTDSSTNMLMDVSTRNQQDSGSGFITKTIPVQGTTGAQNPAPEKFVPIAGVTSDGFHAAPLNPEFIRYVNEKPYNSKVQDGTQHLGLVPSPISRPEVRDIQMFAPNTGDRVTSYPSTFDLRTTGKVSPIKNQDPWGTCWAFATFASLESTLMPTTPTPDFSEKNLVNLAGFVGSSDPETGGHQWKSTAYLTRWNGPVNEATDPYPTSTWTTSSTYPPVKHVQNVVFFPARTSRTDTDNIKGALTQWGAVLSGFYWSPSFYNTAQSSYYQPESATNPQDGGGHAVTIIGWDDAYAATNFNTAPAGPGAWIVKNSWGTTWGNNGYFYMSYYDKYFGSVLQSSTSGDTGGPFAVNAYGTAVFFGESTSNYDTVYSYDKLGEVNDYVYPTTSKKTGSFANVFTATSSGTIKAVGFYTTDLNVPCNISIYKNPTSGPVGGTPAASFSTTLPYMGYNTVVIPSSQQVPVTAGDRFSVVVQVTNPTYEYYIPIEENLAGYTSGITSQSGQGYLLDSSGWTDLKTLLDNSHVCVKAYTGSGTPSPKSWSWNFGDGDSTNSTVQNPIHTYTRASTYTVSLTATNAAGSDTKTVANYITVNAASGADNVGVYRSGVFYRNGADAITYGLSTDTPVIGDWNGDGMSEVGVYRGGVFYRNGADAITYGLSTDTPVVGDWNGDGMSEVGVYRSGVFYRNGADAITYGLSTDTPVIGDWNGDGISEVGVYRGGVFYRNGASAVVYGLLTDTPVVGDWNGDGISEVGVYRDGVFYRNGADAIVYGLSTDTPVIGKWT